LLFFFFCVRVPKRTQCSHCPAWDW
jgi:hypothetical protein